MLRRRIHALRQCCCRNSASAIASSVIMSRISVSATRLLARFARRTLDRRDLRGGMPCISDPGEGIVRLAVQHGIPITLSRAIGFCFCRRGVRPRYETICLRRFHPARGSERRKLIERSRWSAVLSSFMRHLIALRSCSAISWRRT